MRIAAPAGPVLVAGVHPVNPMSGVGPWVSDAERLHTWLSPHFAEPLVIAGDFNAIDRHATMQPYWRSGFSDAADLAGSGVPRTWPVNHPQLLVPLIAIDHVLLGPGLGSAHHEVLQLPETDHAALRVGIGFSR